MNSSPSFTGAKAIHLNLKEDGLKQRAVTFRNRKKYTRTSKYGKQYS